MLFLLRLTNKWVYLLRTYNVPFQSWHHIYVPKGLAHAEWYIRQENQLQFAREGDLVPQSQYETRNNQIPGGQISSNTATPKLQVDPTALPSTTVG